MKCHIVNQTKIPVHEVMIILEANPVHIALDKSDYSAETKEDYRELVFRKVGPSFNNDKLARAVKQSLE
jgi:hypothetical protein